MVITFVLTLVIPLQYAVLIGVGISIILFVTRQSNKIRVVRWRFEGGPLPVEETPPPRLGSREIVVLNVYGSLFFASAPIFVAQLPAITPESAGAVVVLRLRGKDDLGSTIIKALLRYTSQLQAVGGHLLIAGVGPALVRQLGATTALDAVGRDNVFRATKQIGASLTAATELANELVSRDGVARD
jgi:SulP family sulfate permease